VSKTAYLSHATDTSRYPSGCGDDWIRQARTLIEKYVAIEAGYHLITGAPTRSGSLRIEGDEGNTEADEVLREAWEAALHDLPSPTPRAVNRAVATAAALRERRTRRDKYR
jgi:hypothetical protein